MSAFDVILGLVLASMLSRAINGSAPFWPTLVGGFVLVYLHRLIAFLSFHSEWIEALVKGEAKTLVDHGQRKRDIMRVHKISDKDLLEEVRLNGNKASLEEVEQATLERNGQVSVVRANS